MNQIKHTPGPWTAEGPDAYGDFNILPAHETLAIGAVVRNGVRPNAVTAANARLVAAAPELLDFVKRFAMRDPVFARAHDKQIIANARELVTAVETQP